MNRWQTVNNNTTVQLHTLLNSKLKAFNFSTNIKLSECEKELLTKYSEDHILEKCRAFLEDFAHFGYSEFI